MAADAAARRHDNSAIGTFKRDQIDSVEYIFEKIEIIVDKCKNSKYNITVGSVNSLPDWRFAEVAELADAHGSGPCGSNTLWVRLPSSASGKPSGC